MDINELIECLEANNQLDDNFALKEKCPDCHYGMDEYNDYYHCPNCGKVIDKNNPKILKK